MRWTKWENFKEFLDLASTQIVQPFPSQLEDEKFLLIIVMQNTCFQKFCKYFHSPAKTHRKILPVSRLLNFMLLSCGMRQTYTTIVDLCFQIIKIIKFAMFAHICKSKNIFYVRSVKMRRSQWQRPELKSNQVENSFLI